MNSKSWLAAGILALAAVAPASAITTVYTAVLSGSAESPPNASPGTGLATVTFDSVLHSMDLAFSFSGLLAPTTAAHIHCCTTPPGSGTAGVATTTPTFPGSPLGVTSGSYSNPSTCSPRRATTRPSSPQTAAHRPRRFPPC